MKSHESLEDYLEELHESFERLSQSLDELRQSFGELYKTYKNFDEYTYQSIKKYKHRKY